MGNQTTIQLIAGQDIGNGYLKCAAENNKGQIYKADMPSCSARVTSSKAIPPRESEVEEIVNDIFNHMDASFDTPLISSGARHIFGKRAIESGLSIVEFDCASHISKAKQDLSNVMILGSLAGFALQDYYAKYKKLPTDTVAVSVRTALALPIEEYRHYRKDYAARFKEGTHMVTIHTFEQRIRVEITFEDVQVLAEGAAAQYAIQEKGEPLVGAMLTVAMQNDPDFNKDGSIKPADVLQAQTVVGIDIGEGTVNYPVFQNGKFNPEASMSYDKGYGSIIIRAIDRLKYMGQPFKSRKELVEYLQKPSTIRRNQYNIVTQVIQEETEIFIIGVIQEFIKILSRIGTFLEVVYVYGGGSGPINKELTEELVKTGKEFGGGYPILYLEAKYSRNLNREGLLFIAKQVAEIAKANAANEKK